MAYRPKRATLLRASLGLASLAFPLVATGAAQAAIAGAQPASMSNVPVLRSATINSSNANEVNVCFSQAIAPPQGGFNFADFAVGGYRAANQLGGSPFNTNGMDPAYDVVSDSSNPDCVNAYFYSPNGTANSGLTQYTYLNAGSDAVTAAGTSRDNITDSVGLGGSASKSGTTGNTTGPDLAGIAAPAAGSSNPNTYTFVFNKPLENGTGGTTTVSTANGNGNPGDFYLVLSSGQVVPGLSAQESATTPDSVSVTFPAETTPFVQGGVFQGAIRSASDGSYNVDESEPAVAGVSCASSNPPTCSDNAPYVTKAVLSASQGTITYTFSQNINPSTINASDFEAELANGSILTGTTSGVASASTTGTSVTVAFNNTDFPQETEFGVYAFVQAGGAAVAGNAAASNSPSGVATGGNAGAFAESFTTAPDVFGIAIAHGAAAGTTTYPISTDAVAVNLDDRVQQVNTADITPYDSTGSDGQYSGTHPAYVGVPVNTDPNSTPCNANVALMNGAGTECYYAAPANGGPVVVNTQFTPGPEQVQLLYQNGALDVNNNPAVSMGFTDGAFVGTLVDTNDTTTGSPTAAPATGSTGQDYDSIPQIDGTVSSSAVVHRYHAKTKKHQKHTKKHSKHSSKR